MNLENYVHYIYVFIIFSAYIAQTLPHGQKINLQVSRNTMKRGKITCLAILGNQKSNGEKAHYKGRE